LNNSKFAKFEKGQRVFGLNKLQNTIRTKRKEFWEKIK
jgi:hypothetical protein